MWTLRKEFVPGSLNIVHPPLVSSSKVLLLALHIKLGLMKQFVKALDENGNCFKYLSINFLGISQAKI